MIAIVLVGTSYKKPPAKQSSASAFFTPASQTEPGLLAASFYNIKYE